MEREKNIPTRFESSQAGIVDEFDISANNGEPSGEWDLVVPETEVFAESVSTRARSSSLKGKTIVLRRNDKPNSDIFLERVGALLSQSVEGVKILKAWEVVPGSDMAKPGTDILKKVAALKPDVVISAQGD